MKLSPDPALAEGKSWNARIDKARKVIRLNQPPSDDWGLRIFSRSGQRFTTVFKDPCETVESAEAKELALDLCSRLRHPDLVEAVRKRLYEDGNKVRRLLEECEGMQALCSFDELPRIHRDRDEVEDDHDLRYERLEEHELLYYLRDLADLAVATLAVLAVLSRPDDTADDESIQPSPPEQVPGD